MSADLGVHGKHMFMDMHVINRAKWGTAAGFMLCPNICAIYHYYHYYSAHYALNGREI